MVTIKARAGYALRDVFLESAFTAEDLRDLGMTWRTIETSRHLRLRHRRGRFEIAPPPLCARLMWGRSWIVYVQGGVSSTLTWAATVRQPSSKRAQDCCWRPTLPGMVSRWNKVEAVAKSRLWSILTPRPWRRFGANRRADGGTIATTQNTSCPMIFPIWQACRSRY
jgi:hypothetical protein